MTEPSCHVSFGNGLGKARISADQISGASPLKISTSPIVMITTVSTDALATGAITTRWIPSPSTNANRSVATNAGQYDQPWCSISAQAMYVVNIAISPCAKLITPVARWISTSASASAP